MLHWNGSRAFNPVNCGFDSRRGYMALTPKYKKNARVRYMTRDKNATVVASDTTRSFRVVYYILRVDGDSRDTYDVSESELRPPR